MISTLIPTIAALTPDTSAAVPGLPRTSFPLWPEAAPGARGREPQDVPAPTPYFAARDGATRAAMVVCPGGGYVGLAPHEGRDYARWLNEQGITAFVLQYRLGSAGYRHPAMLQDAARAVHVARGRATEWGLDPRRIGIMGSSAGGHLAATLLTHFDAGDPSAADPIERESSRPDLGVLCYPVITMGEQGHAGCRQSLLGDAPWPELVRLLSNEQQVTSDTPPTFLFHTVEDTGVPVQNSLLFAAALAAHGVPFALHVYPQGVHGMGLGSREWDPAARHPWTTQCARWLQEQEFAR
jgi:acetyl esterase/lipase